MFDWFFIIIVFKILLAVLIKWCFLRMKIVLSLGFFFSYAELNSHFSGSSFNELTLIDRMTRFSRFPVYREN